MEKVPALSIPSISRYAIFIKGKVDKGGVSIKNFPTEDMWPEILTKLKQGRAYRKFRKVLMNIDDENADLLVRRRKDASVISWKQPMINIRKCNSKQLAKRLKLGQAKDQKPFLWSQPNTIGLQECVGGQRSERVQAWRICHWVNNVDPLKWKSYSRKMPMPSSE